MSATVSVETSRPAREADPRSFARAVADLRAGLDQRELWAHLGWQDIKQRYRRSFLGPIWITITMGITALAMGLLYSQLFKQDVAVFLPKLTVGLIVWGLISGCILEGSEVFSANVGLITQLPAPLSVHVYRMVWRQLLLFAHNLVIYLILMLVFPKDLHWTDLTAFAALGLLAVNGIWIGIVAGIVSTRFRDVSPILASLVNLLFFLTPIVWTADQLPKDNTKARFVEVNPFFHYLDIIRAPMLGENQQAYHWYIVLGITAVGCALAFLFLRNYRARVPYWV